MNRAQKSWLLPTALSGYIALAGASSSSNALNWLFLLVPIALAWSLRSVSRRAESGQLETGVGGLRLSLIGLAIFVSSLSSSADNAALRAAGAAGQGLVVAGALLAIAQQTPPPGLLQGHPAARSLDALGVSVVLWSATTLAILLRVVAPDSFPLDPIALDLALTFAALGSLLLLTASLLRTKLLRGLEMGVGDRASAALALAVAGTAIGAGSGIVKMATPDRLAGLSLVFTSITISTAVAVPQAAMVTRAVRGFLALLILGTPVALAGAWFAMKMPHHAASIALSLATLSMVVGLIARNVARPLAPEGSRWLNALTRSMTAALHPQPEMALRAALMELRQAEPSSPSRPEVFRVEPSGLLSVDIAGYLTEKPVDFPEGVLLQAIDEPARTLRLESIRAAQVRWPKVRPLVNWFEAHRAKTATVLMDEAGPVGLLILPRGIRKSALAMEEAELLAQLAERLAGLISVSSSLRRSRERELDYRKQAEHADAQMGSLRDQLEEQTRSDYSEAETRVESLLSCAHSPAAQIKLQELSSVPGTKLTLRAPLGVDPIPWAAYVHLSRFPGEVEGEGTQVPSPRRPLVIVDFSERKLRTQELWSVDAELSPWRRAQGGTLVLLHPGTLPEQSQVRLSDALAQQRPALVIVCETGRESMIRRLERELDGALIHLPTLAERAEDLQALVLNELSQLGLTRRGNPYGIDRAALYELIERPFPGNDAELKGLLAAAVGHAQGDRVELSDLRALYHEEESAAPPPAFEVRSRARLAPRSRRR